MIPSNYRQPIASISDYATFLERFDFTYYGTFTTGYSMSLDAARDVMERYFNEISKAGQTMLFWVAENYELKDGYHTHGLLQTPEEMSYQKLIDTWQWASGGKKADKWNRLDLQRYDKKKGGRFYLSKHMRYGRTDYDLWFS